MLRIQYNNEFLLLQPGSAIEMERYSPLFLADDALAEYSLPVTILYCEDNARLLGDVFFDYGIKTKLKVDVKVYDNVTFRFRCTMVIDKSISNRSQPGKGNVQGYLLTGASDFFTLIKDKKMSDLKLGDIRSFPFTSWDPFDSSGGFWQHVHDTWTGDFDYVFVPIRNQKWQDDDNFHGWMNLMGRGKMASDSMPYEEPGQFFPYIWPIPQLKFHKVLKLVITEFGWKLDASALDNTHWEKILVFNVYPIKTTEQTGIVDDIPTFGEVNPVKVDLRKYISPEVTITDFILSHCKRYGWAPIFDSGNKTVTLLPLKDAADGPLKDFTAYAGSVTRTDFSAEPRKFSFITNLPENDGSVSSPDFTNYTIQNPVFRRSQLPAPSTEYDNSLIFAFYENAWYKCVFDETVNNRIWEKFCDNIYSDEVKNNTDSIETNASTMGIVRSTFRTSMSDEVFDGLFAQCEQPRNKEWGIRNLLYHGMVTEIKQDGTPGTVQYPYASPTVVLPDGSIAEGWSTVYRHKHQTKDYGIIEYWFNAWLRLLRVNTPILRNLYLPLHELEDLKWNTKINILNQPFFLLKYLDPIPYQGYIQATLLPITLNDNQLSSATTSTNIAYLKFEWQDEVDAPDIYIFGILSFTSVKKAKPIIKSFADAAGTVPLFVSGLKVIIGFYMNIAGTDVFLCDYSTFTSGVDYNISQDELSNETNPTTPYPATSDGLYDKSYKDADGNNPVEFKWVIKPSTGYLVI